MANTANGLARSAELPGGIRSQRFRSGIKHRCRRTIRPRIVAPITLGSCSTFFGETADLLNPKDHNSRVTVGWSRIADWLPWMKMNAAEGRDVHAHRWQKLGTFDEL